ncbi:MAG: methyltransferase RsmF C-terminal domain-like protein [Syntrophobacteria bacterium]
MRKLIERGKIRASWSFTPGYVIVAVQGLVVGCALYLPGRLISQIPRHLFTPRSWEHFGLEQHSYPP